MSDIVEPNWIKVARFAVYPEYEEEMDLNSKLAVFRWRERRYSGQPIDPWKPGSAPLDKAGKSPHRAV